MYAVRAPTRVARMLKDQVGMRHLPLSEEANDAMKCL
jgi:hypothetical protein